MSAESRDPERFQRLLEGQILPAAVVDLDALERNVATLLERVQAGTTLRIASKSVRHTGLLRRILELGGDRMRGLMTYSAQETRWLAEQGFDDLLIAYPFARPEPAAVVAELASAGTTAIATVDAVGQIDVLAEAARARGVVVPVCLDVDMSLRPAGGLAHFGVRRSPVRAGTDAVPLAEHIDATEGVELRAVLAYEAQVAGMRDRNPGSRHLDPIRQLVKRWSLPVATSRRRDVVDALTARGTAPAIVNGGGTGSVAFTSRDPTVTEVTAGSGFLCPHLFDGYHGLPLEPAAFFALEVVRASDPDHITCLGGGYAASGAAGADRLPVVHAPQGLKPLDLEGWGEVQTPFKWTGTGAPPELGSAVVCRHGKAGELAERFDSYLLVRGDRVVAREPTYRGMGACFL